jgi:thiol:disulfide interchange protein DsbD
MLQSFATLAAIVCTAGVQPPEQPARARARLIAEHAALVPGATSWLGVTFDIDKDWHLYWNGASDTGFPIKLTPTLPEGYTLGEVLWPAPTRHLTKDFLDHVYENRVTLLLPLQVPASAKAGERVTVKVQAEWLVCKQACLPGEAVMTLTLPVAAAAGPLGPDASRFDEARANVAKPLSKEKPEITVNWSGDEVRVSGPEGARGLAFYPAQESTKVPGLATQGESASGTLKLRVEHANPGDRLVGVVEVSPGGTGPRKLFAIDSARPAVNPPKGGASDLKQPRGG